MELNWFKYIVINDEIRISSAAYHKWLLKDNEYSCDGGGLVSIDIDDKLIIFFGQSEDFGKVPNEKLKFIINKCREDIDNSLYFLFNEIDTTDYIIKIF